MSKEKRQVLAFDFGASSGRAILGRLEDGKIVMEEVHRFSNDPVKIGDTLYWDTLRQFYEIKQGILKAKLNGGFESIAIDTWGVDFGLLDKQDKLLENAVHYRDERTLGKQEEVFKEFSKSELYGATGIQFNDFNTIFQLYSLVKDRPELLERAETLLLTPDLFNFFLTGEKKTEYTMATTTQLFEAKNREWYKELFEVLGIKENIFPEVVPSGTIVGEIREDICQELGINVAKVIAVAGHDTA
ncbi:MAG: rhamnulokinase, partial [Lachnospiraceae bacterium]|nr:rhamnulokinase [Lachnospiraceae bacterium]